MIMTLYLHPMNDCEEKEHISLSCEDFPNGKPVLAIHGKGGKIQAQWKFENTEDLFNFATMCMIGSENIDEIAARQKNNL